MVDKATLQKIGEFEWSAKSLDNLLWSLQRHTSAQQRPDPVELNKFSDFAYTALKTITKKMIDDHEIPLDYMLDYPE